MPKDNAQLKKRGNGWEMRRRARRHFNVLSEPRTHDLKVDALFVCKENIEEVKAELRFIT